MIKDIQLKNFIAHKDTKIEFCKGITIFLGHNGSGKSSIIDAVTFSLFGKHTRKSNRNLVRRGANHAMTQMHFALNSKEFEATRALNGSGLQSFSQLVLVSDGDKIVNKPIVGGERRQFGESMSVEIARVLGMDYEKLRVAGVMQQGELVRIVEAQPKDFKELLNGLIGIDRLDSAYETMRNVIIGFRERLRDEIGYTDEEIPKVESLLEQKEKQLKEGSLLLKEFEDERSLLEEKLSHLEKEIDRMEPIIQKTQELQNCEKLLIRHVVERRSHLNTEVNRMERIVTEAKNLLEVLKTKEEVQIRLKMIKAESEEIHSKLEENEGIIGKLRGFLECANKLHITDGKCPICNSNVTKINEMYNVDHIQFEISHRSEEKYKLQVAKVELKKEEQELLEQDKKIVTAEKFLSNNSILSENDLAPIEEDLDSKQKYLAKLPPQIAYVGDDPFKLVMDGISKTLAEEIITLRRQISGLSVQQYTDAKLERTRLIQELQNASAKTGEYRRVLSDAQAAIDSAKHAIDQLRRAYKFSKILERIRSMIFNRDGMVGISLRSWALGVISHKASEYASLFNIGISRIELTEEAREVAITCYGRQGEIDMDSLSGGEKVAVALALRLSIAYMMGSNKLDFIILDEPTAHLDEERRRGLVRILSDAFREGVGPLTQLIIITHDSEIFENSEVDQIFRFTMTADGSCISRE
ncbi:MAG: AAA family ATPase [Thermoproteota archaeon]|nr:AAA family ATPase [Thermoproteota archaeon]